MLTNGILLIVGGFGCLLFLPVTGMSLIALGHLVLLGCCFAPLLQDLGNAAGPRPTPAPPAPSTGVSGLDRRFERAD